MPVVPDYEAAAARLARTVGYVESGGALIDDDVVKTAEAIVDAALKGTDNE